MELIENCGERGKIWELRKNTNKVECYWTGEDSLFYLTFII